MADPLLSFLISAGFEAGKEFTKNGIKDLLKFSASKIKELFIGKPVAIRESGLTAGMASQMKMVRQIKPFWQPNKSVDIFSFYQFPHTLDENKRVILRGLRDLPQDNCILIRGIAGQGKSLFSRYLLCSELCRGVYLPIFVELRKTTESIGVLKMIEEVLVIYGVSPTSAGGETTEEVLRSGLSMLILDGFDEVSESISGEIAREIDEISRKFPNTKIVVTSRPDSAMEKVEHFKSISIAFLVPQEQKSLIKTLCCDQRLSETLISTVHGKASTRYQDLLRTPMMVALLVHCYKSFNQIPESLSEFYECLWNVMTKLHDGTKPYFKRVKSSGINDTEFRSIFNSFCYASLKSGKTQYLKEDVFSFAEISIRKIASDLSGRSEDVLDDIIKISCLLLRDGSEFRFVHKSVQEYFASCYIKELTSDKNKQFYDACLRSHQESTEVFSSMAGQWGQVLVFLSDLNPYPYFKFYLVPLVISRIGLGRDDILNLTTDEIIDKSFPRQADGMVIGIEVKGGSLATEFEHRSVRFEAYNSWIVHAIHIGMGSKVLRMIVDKLPEVRLPPEDAEMGRGRKWYSMRDCWNDESISQTIRKLIKRSYEYEVSRFKDGIRFLEKAEKVNPSDPYDL